ncbi:WW domain-containing oxidoreductase [Mycena venus]|uniref:WW domain-containing oxidoreductase n=1 Tax=Mycena venus TaxID=2733690 RepID=A0A8H6XSU0_9AGAR|nr:WW domain-containing oxidoreductase [Mycena venus]
MRYSFWSFIVEQWKPQPPALKADLTSQTVLVLGANTGTGFEASKHFATKRPERLILACRSQSKGQAAVGKLKAETGYTKAGLWIIDLADFSSVRRFADKFEREGGRLDIFVENAAIGSSTYNATKDNWDISQPPLHLASGPPLAPSHYQNGTIALHDPQTCRRFERRTPLTVDKTVYEDPDVLKTLGGAEYCSNPKNMRGRYPLTKLFNLFFVRALNSRLPFSTPLVITSVTPGYCYSELRREFSGMMAVIDWFMEKALAFSSSAEVGSRRLVWSALSHQDQPEKLRGEYSSNFQIVEASDFALSPEGVKMQVRSWNELVEILGKVDPRVAANVEKYLSRKIEV